MSEYIKKANQVISELNKEVESFISSIKQKAREESANKVPQDLQKFVDKSTVMPGCPISENVPKMTEGERNEAQGLIERLKQDITKEPHKFLDTQRGEDREFTGGSKDAGNQSRAIRLIYLQEPDWFKQIKAFCSNYKKSQGKEYFDEEMMVRGRLSKKKEKTKVRDESLYVLLDVSGSMWYYTYKGIPLIQLMASYMPSFAKKFSGFFVQSDGPRVVIGELAELKTYFKNKKQIELEGGSGANYILAIQTIKQHSMDNFGEKNPTIVLFTDMDEDFPNPMPPNILVVTTSDKKSWIHESIEDQNFPSEKLNQKVIFIDVTIPKQEDYE